MPTWPWVSRGRFDDLQGRYSAAETERVRLMNLLLERPATVAAPTAAERSEAPVKAEEPERGPRLVRTASDEAPMSRAYSTPFDSIGNRFDAARRNGGAIAAKFQVRI